jgi:hypothetical protein
MLPILGEVIPAHIHKPCITLLWRIDPFLRGDCVTATVSVQRLGKHVPAATNTYATIELLLQMSCFYMVRAEMLQARNKVGWELSSAWEAVKIEPERVKLKNLHC